MVEGPVDDFSTGWRPEEHPATKLCTNFPSSNVECNFPSNPLPSLQSCLSWVSRV